MGGKLQADRWKLLQSPELDRVVEQALPVKIVFPLNQAQAAATVAKKPVDRFGNG
jgi:hypothetical protein